jgi:hypothetical protein
MSSPSPLKSQLPIIIGVILLVIVAVGFGFYMKSANEKHAASLEALRQQHAAELKAAAEDTRLQIESVNTLLRDAIQKRSADAFLTDEEFAKANEDKIGQLAQAIATKIQPFNPLPKSPEEAEQIQNEQTDRISARMADKISPILTEMSKDQNLTRDQIAAYSQRISDQVGVVLTSEMARNQQLNAALSNTQVVARDSLRLSQEVTALYLASFKDQGILTRILSLPANVIKDATSLSIVNSADRKKMEERLFSQLNQIEQRLNQAQAAVPKK